MQVEASQIREMRGKTILQAIIYRVVDWLQMAYMVQVHVLKVHLVDSYVKNLYYSNCVVRSYSHRNLIERLI